jgi:hypothetical protein
MEPYLKNITDGLSTVSSMSDEIAQNTIASVDLTIAISSFNSSGNLKNFTFMSILFQPVAIGTGWYGMNWSNMPELEFENGYYLFAGLVWAVAIIIFAKFYLVDVWDSIQTWCYSKPSRRGGETDEDGVLPWVAMPRTFAGSATGLVSEGGSVLHMLEDPVKPFIES